MILLPRPRGSSNGRRSLNEWQRTALAIVDLAYELHSGESVQTVKALLHSYVRARTACWPRSVSMLAPSPGDADTAMLDADAAAQVLSSAEAGCLICSMRRRTHMFTTASSGDMVSQSRGSGYKCDSHILFVVLTSPIRVVLHKILSNCYATCQ